MPPKKNRGKRARSSENTTNEDATNNNSIDDALDGTNLQMTQLTQSGSSGGGVTKATLAAIKKAQLVATKQAVEEGRDQVRSHAMAHAPAHPPTHWDRIMLDALQRQGVTHSVPHTFNIPTLTNLRPPTTTTSSSSTAAATVSTSTQQQQDNNNTAAPPIYFSKEHRGLKKLGRELQIHHEAAERQRRKEIEQQDAGCSRMGEVLGRSIQRRWAGIHNTHLRQLKAEGTVRSQMEQERKQEEILKETEEITSNLIKNVVEEAKTRSRQKARQRRIEGGEDDSAAPGAFTELEGDKTIHERDLILLNTLNGERPLRDYQRTALQWMVQLYTNGLNGILADEMGLGKTVQTIALLCYYAQHRQDWGPHLIVVPTTVVLNWEMELMRWAPGLKTLTYMGSAEQRKKLRVGWSKEGAFDVCITSYNLIVNDRSVFRRRAWGFLILDEAHQIKNFASQKWQSLFDLQAQYRLLLTGTPLQNSVMELWSLLHFLLPNATAFSSHEEFQNWYSNPMNEMVSGVATLDVQVVSRLQTLLRPFMLRRLKKDVESQLPTKREVVIRCKLSSRQQTLYEEFMTLYSKQTVKNPASAAEGVFGAILHLRKTCNHPALFEDRSLQSSFVPDRHDRIKITIPAAVLVAVGTVHRSFSLEKSNNNDDVDGDSSKFMCSMTAFSNTLSTTALQTSLPGWCGLLHGALPTFLAPPSLRGSITSMATLSPCEAHGGDIVSKQQWLAMYDVDRLSRPQPTKGIHPRSADGVLRSRDLLLQYAPQTGPRKWLHGMMDKRNLHQSHGSDISTATSSSSSSTTSSVIGESHHRKHKLTAIAASQLIGSLPPIDLLTRQLVQPYLTSTTLAGSYSSTWGSTPVTATGHSIESLAVCEYRRHLRNNNTNTSTANPTLMEKLTLFRPRVLDADVYDRTTSKTTTTTTSNPHTYGWAGGSIGHPHPARTIIQHTSPTSSLVKVNITATTAPTTTTKGNNNSSGHHRTITVVALVEDLNMRVDGFYGTGLGYGGGSVFGEDSNGIGLREVITWKRRAAAGDRFPLRYRQYYSSLRNISKQFAIFVQPIRVVPANSAAIANSVSSQTVCDPREFLSESRHRIGGTTCGAVLGGHAPELVVSFPSRHRSLLPSGQPRSSTYMDVPAPFLTTFGKGYRYLSTGDIYDGLRHHFQQIVPYAPKTMAISHHVFSGNGRLCGPLVPSSSSASSGGGGAVIAPRSARALTKHPLWETTTNHVVWSPDRQALIHDSGKLQVLAELLPKLRAGSWYTEEEEEPSLVSGCGSTPQKRPHRALIFTQFTAMLDILQRFLAILGIPSLRIDGATKPEVRQQHVDRFNRDERITCMVLSTRSGGIGLNLTGADTVIFYDSDWNPTVDLQAQDRVHRIGQTRNVTIYRLVVANSVEEKILEKARQRKKLNNVVIRSGAFNHTAWDHHQQQQQATQQQAIVSSGATNTSPTPLPQLTDVAGTASTATDDASSNNYADVFRTLHSQQSLMTFFHANDEDTTEVVGEGLTQRHDATTTTISEDNEEDMQKAMAAAEDEADRDAMARFELEEAERKKNEAREAKEDDAGDDDEDGTGGGNNNTTTNAEEGSDKEGNDDNSCSKDPTEQLLQKRVHAMQRHIGRRLVSDIERDLLLRLPSLHPHLVASHIHTTRKEEQQMALNAKK